MLNKPCDTDPDNDTTFPTTEVVVIVVLIVALLIAIIVALLIWLKVRSKQRSDTTDGPPEDTTALRSMDNTDKQTAQKQELDTLQPAKA